VSSMAIVATRQAHRAERLQRVQKLFTDILTADPDDLGHEVKFVDLLDRAAPQITDILKSDPRGEIEIRETLGKAYLKLGRYAQSERELGRAYKIRCFEFGTEEPATLEAAHRLADVWEDLGRYPEAEALFRKTLKAQEAMIGLDHTNTLSTMAALGGILLTQTKLDEAKKLISEAYERRKALFGEENPETVKSKSQQAWLASQLQDLDGAEAIRRQVIEIAQKKMTLNPGDRESGRFLESAQNGLESILAKREKLDEFEMLLTNHLSTLTLRLGNDHPSVLRSKMKLAILRRLQFRAIRRHGQFHLPADDPAIPKLREADTLIRETLKTQESVLGKEHPDVLFTVSNLANILADSDNRDQAVELLRKYKPTFDRVYGSQGKPTLDMLYNLALHLEENNDLEKSAEAFKEVSDSLEKVFGKDHRETLDARSSLAGVLAKEGRRHEAMTLYRNVLADERRTLGSTNEITLKTISSLASLLTESGDLTVASELAKELLIERRRRTEKREINDEERTRLEQARVLLSRALILQQN
jgi:tetratricopeptide (TPR) repeat protein